MFTNTYWQSLKSSARRHLSYLRQPISENLYRKQQVENNYESTQQSPHRRADFSNARHRLSESHSRIATDFSHRLACFTHVDGFPLNGYARTTGHPRTGFNTNTPPDDYPYLTTRTHKRASDRHT